MGNVGPQLAAGASPPPSSVATYANESAAIASLGTSLLIAALQLQGNNNPSTGTFLSPLSIYSALMLALNGAEPGSQTHQELLRLLSPSSSPSSNEATLNAQLAALDMLLQSNSSDPAAAADAPCTMLIANGIFTTSRVDEEYSRLMASLFQATTQTVSGAEEINAWVSKNTRGEIPLLLDPHQPFHTVLANALYFKGTWKHKFSKSMTQPALFHSQAGQRKVSMMKTVFMDKDSVKVESVASKYDAVELPYLGGQYSALAVLPREGVTLEDTLRALNAGPGQNNVIRKVPYKTIVSMPKFRAESSVELKESLQGLGVEAAFQPSSANFNRITTELYIDQVVHKTVVDVDEKGAVAAAATAVTLHSYYSYWMAEEEPFELVFDRPFVFLVRHVPSGAPVFMGVVTAPPEASA